MAMGASYAVAACAAHYELTSDPKALDLAKEGFAWLDKFSHDDELGGYFALYTREGARILSAEQCARSRTPGAIALARRSA